MGKDSEMIGDREIIERFTKMEMTLVNMCEKIDASLERQDKLAVRLTALEKARLIYTGGVIGIIGVISCIYQILTGDLLQVIRKVF